jgi:tetratricopeptide (TPR) repeat protein
MNLNRTHFFAVYFGIGASILSGCNPVTKVQDTMTLNDLQIRAGVAEDAGDDRLAYQYWSDYVDKRPQSAMGEYRLGLVETRLGLTRQAIGHLRTAYDLKPSNVEYIEALADVLVIERRTESLMQLMRASINEGEPGSGVYRLAKYAELSGQMDEARDALMQAIAQGQGETARPYLAMADFSRSIQSNEDEVRYLRNALWFDQSNPELLARLESLGMIAGPSLALRPEM